MKRILPLLSAVALALFFASCDKKAPATDAEPIKVKTLTVSPSDIAVSPIYSATVEEGSGTTLSFPVAGTVQQVAVQQGDRVKKGQVIASLDPRTLQDTYNTAKAGLNSAQDLYNRMKKLHDTKSIPDVKWVEVENALVAAKSLEATAKRALGDAVLTAPFDGFISQKYLDANMTITPITPVVKLVVTDPVKVKISVPESEVTKIEVGDGAVLTLSTQPGKKYMGKVKERGISANPITRSYDVKIEISNPDDALLPGMIGDVRLDKEKVTNAIVLPVDVVFLDSDNRNFVWLAVNGKARKRLVQVSGMTDNGLVIESGLAAGDVVLTSGQQKVSNNTPLDIIE